MCTCLAMEWIYRLIGLLGVGDLRFWQPLGVCGEGLSPLLHVAPMYRAVIKLVTIPCNIELAGDISVP